VVQAAGPDPSSPRHGSRRPSRSPGARRPTPRLRSLLVGAGLLLAACGDDPGPSAVDAPPPPTLAALSGEDQVIQGGKRSPAPFRVQLLDARGAPLAGLDVRFAVDPSYPGGGILSQPVAVTDGSGTAETFLLDARAGEGVVEARVGSARVAFGFRVDRAPGRIVFEPSTGAVGYPSLPHPDSLLEVTLLDTDGLPLENWPVLFAASGEVAAFTDTTDARGRASTHLVRSGPEAGDGSVFAFVLGTDVLARDVRPVVAPARRVVVVSIEGLRGDALERHAPPVLGALAVGGSWTDRATTVLPSLTVPAHLSMLAGVPPDEHGIHSDRMEVSQEMAGLDPLFRRARRNGVSGAAVMSREGPLSGFGEILECRQAFGLDRLTLTAASARAALEPALEVLADSSVALLFVHFPDPDVAGHAHGWLSPEYGEAVLAADSALGVLVEAARGPGQPPTIFLVTSPHGGGGALGDFQHGSGSPEDLQVPLILHGPGIQAGGRLGESTLLEVAPTTLWALGIRSPLDYRGRVLLEAAGAPE
jgi:hypothetical protein